MRAVQTLFLLLCLPCAGWAQVLTLPPTTTGMVYDDIIIEAKTDGETVQWVPMDKGLNLFPVHLLKDTKTAVVRASKPGTYRLLAYTAKDNKPSAPVICSVVVKSSDVTPTPDPEPNPDDPPVPPQPKGFRVLFIYETSGALTPAQLVTLNSTEITKYLNAKTVKGADGLPSWRRWDKDIDVTNETPVLKELWGTVKPTLSTLPAVVIVNDGKAEIFALPENEASTLALLRKYGGQ